jgi:hypothetical protein
MTKLNSIPGLNFRPRHLIIVVLYFGIILGLLVPVARYLDHSGLVNPALLILVLSPWILGVLVLAVERKGPVKYWAAPLLLSFTAPALAVYHDLAVVDGWLRYGTSANNVVTLALNFILVGSFTLFLVAMRPESCPECGRRALIPLLRVWIRQKRTARTHWCGRCGAKFWKDSQGTWQNERRKTWVDELESEQANALATSENHAGGAGGLSPYGPHAKNPRVAGAPAPTGE